MEKFVIQGGNELSGTIRSSGSKNEVLPCVAATLLSDQPIVLRNVPRIEDVLVLIQILQEMGGSVEWTGDNELSVDNSGVTEPRVPFELCRKLRASILLAGPLLARFGWVELPPPGGDVIGRRRLDTHFLGFEALGAEVETDGAFMIRAKRLVGADIFLDEPSVTGTENILMAAVAARGTTTIQNAACEPHVQGLCRMLNTMGAHIEGIGTNTVRVRGTKSLWGGTHEIGPDYLEVGSFIGLAAMTRSAITIEGVRPADMRMIQLVFGKLGIRFEMNDQRVFVPKEQERRIQNDFMAQIPKIDDAPWPMFPTDMMSVAITTATQCDGTVIFFEKMFDGRMFFTDSLVGMGAKIILCDPHRVVVNGPARLVGATLSSPDVRAGMSLLLAALAASGESTIYNVRHIDRGYERVEEKLTGLGARIERLPA